MISTVLHQLFRGITVQDAAAGVDIRSFRFPNHLRRTADLAIMSVEYHLVARQVNRVHWLIVALRLEDVLRDIH